MTNGYAVYPQCVIVQSLTQARRLAAAASQKAENEFRARVESCDTEKIVARYAHGEEE